MIPPRKSHWNNLHASRDPTSVSWYEPRPRKSLELIEAAGLARMETSTQTHATPAGSLQQFVYCRFRVAA